MIKELIEEFELLPLQEDVKEHSRRVKTIALLIANNLMDIEEGCLVNLKNLEVAALYHDVGKMYIPKEILNKPGKLTPNEMARMKLHVKLSGKYAEKRGISSEIIKIILHHHEACNGKGYPFGLKKESLSIESKILRVADNYDAMTSDRPYRDALSQNEALDIILAKHEEYDMLVLRMLFEVLGLRNVKEEKSA